MLSEQVKAMLEGDVGWFVGGLICLGIAAGPTVAKMSWLRKALNID